MSENNTDDSIERQETMHSGASIKGKMKMESGTRDQATLVIKGKGVDTDEAVEAFDEALDAAENGEWGHRLLDLNPEHEDNDE